MKMNVEKLDKKLTIVMCTSIVSVIVGFFLYIPLVPIQDYNLLTEEQVHQYHQDTAINPIIGKLLLVLGFIGLAITIIGYIYMYIHWRKSKK